MENIKSKETKNQVRSIIESIRNEIAGFDFDLDQITELFKVIKNNKENASINAENQMQIEIDCAMLGTLCTGCYSIALINKEAKTNLLPSKWLNEDGSPDPNYLFHSFFSHISNTSISAVNLIQHGFDSQARALVRVYMESVALNLILLANQSLSQIYCDSKNMNRDLWNKYFSPGSLGKKLSEVESKLGIEKKMIHTLIKRNEMLFSLYSDNIHTTYNSLAYFSYSFPFSGDSLQSSLWGASSTTSLQTLRDLNWYNYYFVFMIDLIFRNILSFSYPTDNDYWNLAVNLKRVYLKFCEKNPQLLGVK